MEGHVSEPARILLFGTSGQVGNRLMTALGSAGYEVTGIDHARCDFATATPKEMATILRAVEPQLVINAAAYTAVDLAETETSLVNRINAEAPTHLANLCEDEKIPFLHFSTDYVFDGQRGAPYDEEAEPHPVGAYAHSKRKGESGVIRNRGYVFRLQWVFDSRGRNFYLTMRKLLAERDELRVVSDQLGSPSHAAHIAEAVAKAAPKLINHTLPPGYYHLAAQGHTSWHGFACAIAKASESPASILPILTSEYPTPAARPKDTRLNCASLASHGITMPHWREGLALAIKESHATS